MANTIGYGQASVNNTIGFGQGALTGADGKIYGVPYNGSTVLRLDPDTGTVDEPFTHGQGTAAFIGGVAAPNGNIYFAPFDADNIYEIDPLTGQKNATLKRAVIFATSHFVTPRDTINKAIELIKDELIKASRLLYLRMVCFIFA